jgi:hypothetical protein
MYMYMILLTQSQTFCANVCMAMVYGMAVHKNHFKTVDVQMYMYMYIIHCTCNEQATHVNAHCKFILPSTHSYMHTYMHM